MSSELLSSETRGRIHTQLPFTPADIPLSDAPLAVRHFAHWPPHMIQLTRLNNQPLMVNSDLIKFVEKAPDTVLTLVSGEKVIVLESAEAVLEKIVAFRQSIIAGPTPHSPDSGISTSSTAPVPHSTEES